METNQEQKYDRAKGTAKYFGVSVPTVWRWAREGKIKAYKLSGGVTVFNIQEIENHLIEVA